MRLLISKEITQPLSKLGESIREIQITSGLTGSKERIELKKVPQLIRISRMCSVRRKVKVGE